MVGYSGEYRLVAYPKLASTHAIVSWVEWCQMTRLLISQPHGYPENGRYQALANKLGRSDPTVWRKERVAKPLFPLTSGPQTLIELAHTVRKMLAREDRIRRGLEVSVKPSDCCRECGSAVFPHTCW